MKKLLSLVLVMAMVMSTFTVTFAATGTGTEADPVVIMTVEDLKTIASDVATNGSEGKYYKLGADLDLSDAKWNDYVIGTPAVPFKGSFDGAQHTITGLKIELPAGNFPADSNELNLGLFGTIGGDGSVKNLGITDVEFYSSATWGYNARAGALAAKLIDNAKVDNCFVRSVKFDVKMSDSPIFGEAGGMIGYVDGAGVEITNSYVTGYNEVNDCIANNASLAAVIKNIAKFENCYAEGSVCSIASGKESAIVNSYSTNTSEWAFDVRGGTLVTVDQLKDLHETLGAAYKAGVSYNNGFPVLAWEPDAEQMSGTGAEDDPYLIETTANLIEASLVENTEGAYFKLNADLDLRGKEWSTYIGTEAAPFQGIFDGNGHVIKNFVLNVPQGNWLADVDGELSIGLFGVVGGEAVVKNLGVEDVLATSGGSWGYNANVGGMIGKLADSAAVDNCYTKSISAETKNILVGNMGGLVGLVTGEGASVYNSFSLGFTDIGDCVATDTGLIGKVESVNAVTNCYSDTTLATVKTDVAEKIVNCYTINLGWAPEGYVKTGETKTLGELKGAYEALGSAYKKGGLETRGLPALAWMNISEITIANGSGTYNDPYQIYNADDLYAMAEFTETAGVYFELMNNIDMAGATLSTYIGTEAAPFAGVFDGNGHIIKNYHINLVKGQIVNGLFAYVGGNAHIYNIGVEDISVTLEEWNWDHIVGGLVGKITDNAALTECYVKNVEYNAGWTITTTESDSHGHINAGGGLFGRADGAGIEIRYCYALGVDRGHEVIQGIEDTLYPIVMYDGGLGGRVDNIEALDYCYSDTHVVHYVTPNNGVSNCYFGMDHKEWWPNSNWAGYLTGVEYLSNLWSIKYLPWSSSIGSPTLKWEHGGYQNLVKGGTMHIENAEEIFGAGVSVIDGRNTGRLSKVLSVPAGKTITSPVELEEGKYYRVSFRGRAADGDAGFTMTLGGNDLTADMSNKRLYDGYVAKVAFVKADATGTVDYSIGSDEAIYIDDVEVIEINTEYEKKVMEDSIRLEHFKVESLQADMYVEDYIADGVEIKYVANGGYMNALGQLTNIPVGFGTVSDSISAYVDIADIRIEKNLDVVIEKIQPVDVKGVNLLDVDGNVVYDIAFADRVGYVKIENNNNEENVKVMVAAYTEGKLTAVQYVEVTETGTYPVGMKLNGADKVKLYVLKDGSFAPLGYTEESYDGLDTTNKVEIHTIGDSIVTTYAEGSTLNGWGQVLGNYFDENYLTVDNSLSRGGMYAEEFLKEPIRFSTMLPKLDKNDYVFIQLSHNDAGYYDIPTFKALITQFVDGAREKGAIPVFVTSPEVFSGATDTIGEDGKYVWTKQLKGFPEALKELAEEKDVPVIDLNAYTHELMAEYGKTALWNMDIWVGDYVHFSPNGAKVLAEYIVSQIEALKLPIADFLK